jgi:hypothetical protein
MTPIGTLDDFVVKSAVGLTRRRLLRSAGTAALGATLATTFTGSRSARASALASDGCSGSPQCSADRCYSDGGCHDTSESQWREYGYADCQCASCTTHCWPVCYSGAWYRCCDCCMDYDTGGGSCSNCPSGAFYKCHCWGATGGSC